MIYTIDKQYISLEYLCNKLLYARFKPAQNSRLIRATSSVAGVAFQEQNNLNCNSICPRAFNLLFPTAVSLYTKLYLTTLQASLCLNSPGKWRVSLLV
jgi:hypothetical protein